MTKLDEMLSKWPMREPTQLEVDEAAERVTATLEAGQLPASIDDSLFAPPLPKTPDEGQTAAPRTSKPGFASPGIAVENKMSKDRTRDRTSFQELAKLATTPPPPSSVVPQSPSSSGKSGVLRAKEADTSDSGIVDLKMIANLDPTGAERAQSTPLADAGLFDDESAPPKPAVAAATAEKITSSAAPAPMAATAVAQPVPASAKASVAPKAAASSEKKGGGGVVLVLGGLVAAAAIAAGAFFFIKSQHAHQAAVATQSTPAPDKAADKNPAKPATTATAAASVALNEPQTTELPDTPTQNADPNKPMLKFHAKPGTGGGGGAVAPQETAAAPTGTVDPKLIANIPTGGAGGGSGDLAEAMKAAAGGGTGLGQGTGGSTEQGSKFAAGSVPQRPSQGQVAGAIGSVMPSAKACLGGDDPMSRATVTFQSDGTVKSVNVTGFAAGKPQEACIKAALSKATVSPFAEATYPVPVTIRSN